MQIHSLTLASKNNKKTGTYVYIPIVKIKQEYFFCRFITAKTPLKVKDIDINKIEPTRPIPKEFYKANNIK